MNSVGFYGKLAGRGDFVSRGLPNTFVEPWDAWLASGMRASQDELGAAWLDAYLTSPLWRFAIAPGLLGGEAVAGVVMPSIDRVGRYFPLTVACLLPANADLGGLVGGDDGWFEQVESLLLSTLEPEAEVEAFEQAVAQLPAPPCGPRIEQSLISGNLLRSEAAIPPLTTALESARYRLDVLRGEASGSGAPILDGGGAAPLAKNLPLGDVDRLILQRPDVVSAERQLAASTEDVGAATAELYPRLDLGGFIGFFALRSGDLGSASRAFELAPSVSWPAFRLGNVRARLRAVEAQSDAALARYQRSLLLAQEDVGNALNQLAEHQRRLVALVQSATHGANALEIANERYRAGAGSYLAVLENQRALYQIREELAQAETASFVNVIALYKALGWGSGDLAPGAGQLAAGESAGANR